MVEDPEGFENAGKAGFGVFTTSTIGRCRIVAINAGLW